MEKTQETTFAFELTYNEVMTVIKSLKRLPYEEVALLLEQFINTYEAQVQVFLEQQKKEASKKK